MAIALQNKRFLFVDLMKGVCIILIVIGHVDTNLFLALGANAERMLETFRVPMYYFISGIFFKHYAGLLDFVRRKLNKILVPFVFFYLFAYLVQMSFSFMPGVLDSVFGEFHWGYIVQPLTQRHWDCNVPLWFLLSLFQVNVLFYLLQMLTENKWIRFVVIALLASLGYVLCACHVKLLFFTDTALVGMPFFVLGSFLKGRNVLKPGPYDRWGLLVFPIVLVVVYFIASDVDIFSQVLPSFHVLYGLSSLAIVALFWFCKNINYVPGINYLGRYSVVVLGTHYVYIPIVKCLLAWSVGLSELALSFATMIVVLVLMFPTVAVLIRLFPRFTAQQELIGSNWRLR